MAKDQQAGEELSEDELEAVSGGVAPVAGPAPPLADEAAGEKGKGSSPLALACVKGSHIKSAVITVR